MLATLSRQNRPAPTSLRRPEDRVAYLRSAIAVLERRSMGSDLLVLRDAIDEVMQLVDHGVLPTEHVAVRPPPQPEGVVGLLNEHSSDPLRVSSWTQAGQVNLQLVQPLEVKPDRPLRAVDLKRQPILAAQAKA